MIFFAKRLTDYALKKWSRNLSFVKMGKEGDWLVDSRIYISAEDLILWMWTLVVVVANLIMTLIISPFSFHISRELFFSKPD